jgi:hypothetical protein
MRPIARGGEMVVVCRFVTHRPWLSLRRLEANCGVASVESRLSAQSATRCTTSHSDGKPPMCSRSPDLPTNAVPYFRVQLMT